MKRGRTALTLAAALASALLACPSLSEIGVGTGDAGADAPLDRSEERGPLEARAPDAQADGERCSPDLRTDRNNCGRCRHDCKQGACKGGVCQPYAIVTDSRGTEGLTVLDGVVYFTTAFFSVERCVADDCSHTLTQVASSQGLPRGISAYGTNVYWANAGFPYDGGYAGSIATCGLSGCPSGIVTLLAPTEQEPVDIAVDNAAVYWTDDYSGLVRSCTVGGCSETPRTLATDPATLSGLAIDATRIYWGESALGNVIQCPLSGCATFQPFASAQVGVAKIDVANGSVYWSANGAILSCPATGCGGAPRVFASGQTSAYAIAHDATHLYWTLNVAGGKILGCPLAKCTVPVVLADMQDSPSSLAVDDTSVYWASSAGLAVMRVSK